MWYSQQLNSHSYLQHEIQRLMGALFNENSFSLLNDNVGLEIKNFRLQSLDLEVQLKWSWQIDKTKTCDCDRLRWVVRKIRHSLVCDVNYQLQYQRSGQGTREEPYEDDQPGMVEQNYFYFWQICESIFRLERSPNWKILSNWPLLTRHIIRFCSVALYKFFKVLIFTSVWSSQLSWQWEELFPLCLYFQSAGGRRGRTKNFP